MKKENFINISDLMELPKRVITNTRIHKKTLLENADLSAADKKLVKDHIAEMTWVAAVKYFNSNIPPYENDLEIFDEVHIIEVTLKKDKACKKIAEMLQKSIPYPLFLFLSFNNSFCVNSALKQINRNDRSKRVITDLQFSDWIDNTDNQLINNFLHGFKFSNLPVLSLKHLYTALHNNIINFQLAKKTGTFNTKPVADKSKLLKQLHELENKIVLLKNTLKKESSFNRKVEINIQIKKLNEQRNTLINSLK